MGSCSNDQHTAKGLDATVGGLVWVRRGNGSWWPGQIMDVDEISDICLDVQKSAGVPIKLLGRDDVTVDWYNLEKTKQVKAFRCGDHDSCIEKAKASLSISSKKRPKHARRENAIILALELETALMSKDYDNNSSGADHSDSEPRGSWSKASPAVSHPSDTGSMSRNTGSSEGKTDSAPELSHSGISFEEAYAAGARPKVNHAKVKSPRTPNDSEDDGNEGIKKRMRGLNDLGVGSGTKELNGSATESAPQGLASVSDLCTSNHLPNGFPANEGRGGLMSSFRKKRSKVVFQDILKRKNRRRMLTKVLQIDTLVSVPIIYDELPALCKSSCYDGKVSGIELNESKRSLSTAILCNNDNKNNSDSTGVSCQNGPSKNASEHSQDAALTCSKLKDCDISGMSELLGYDSSENLFDVPLISEEELSDGFPPRTSLKPDAVRAHLSQSGPVHVGDLPKEPRQESGSTSSATAHGCYLAQKTEKGPSEWQLKGKRNSRHHNKNSELDCKTPTEPESNSKADVSDPANQPDRFPPSQRKPFLCQQSRFSLLSGHEIPDPSITSTYVESVLYDVHIEVKASYRPQHVPYISLMSKLNGKPVTGHPIAVEVLEDIPRSYLTSGTGELDEADGLTETRKRSSKKQMVSGKSPKAKKHGSLTKKTRTLSSLTGSRDRKLVVRSLKAPALACIPLKVVFSRINEALNGSTRAVKRVS